MMLSGEYMKLSLGLEEKGVIFYLRDVPRDRSLKLWLLC